MPVFTPITYRVPCIIITVFGVSENVVGLCFLLGEEGLRRVRKSVTPTYDLLLSFICPWIGSTEEIW